MPDIERAGADYRCNCMVLFDPVLAPAEHAEDCQLRNGILQYRARTDDRPSSWWDSPDQEGLWDADREEATDAAEILSAIGATNVRIEQRIHLRPISAVTETS